MQMLHNNIILIIVPFISITYFQILTTQIKIAMIKKWVELNFEDYVGKEAQLFDTIFTFTHPFSWSNPYTHPHG